MPAQASTRPLTRTGWSPAAWRLRVQNWWLQRLAASDRLVLTHRNLYILPTRAGLMLGITLLLLLVGSINYQLNLGYLLTFMLAGCAVVALHLTHLNLRGLELTVKAAEAAFAGEAAPVRVQLHNPGRRTRYAVGLSWQTTATKAAAEPVWCDVPAQGSSMVELSLTFTQRGRHALPPLLVQTRFPLGTTRAWHWWRPAPTCLVYPAPEPAPPPLPLGGGDGDAPATTAQTSLDTGQELDGVRPYRRGDPLKWVLWKKVARTADGATPQWVSRDQEPPTRGHLWLDMSVTGIGDREAALSRLCAWVLEAERSGIPYGLRLPNAQCPPALGPQHRQRCLEALACA